MADEATALDILASQKRYYDMRADRESEWLGSSGDWDYGVEQNLAWERERDAIAQRLESSVGPAIRLRNCRWYRGLEQHDRSPRGWASDRDRHK